MTLLRVAAVVIPVLALLLLARQQANVLLAKVIPVAFGASQASFRATWFEWDGDVVAKDLVIRPVAGSTEASVQFARVHLDGVGWGWFLRHVFDRPLANARLEQFHLTLDGAEAGAEVDPSLGLLGPFGAVSASPFEAEGCVGARAWTREELGKMGLRPEPTRLEFDFRIAGNEVLGTIVQETRGASRVQLDRRHAFAAPLASLLAEIPTGTLASETWRLNDQGFVSARNRYCAKQDGIEGRRFLERHVESVDRLLAAIGVSVDAQARTSYRRFARDGGHVSFGGDYSSGTRSTGLHDARRDAALLAGMTATIDHNDRASTVRWLRLAPRPIAASERGLPTYAALQRERAAALSSMADTRDMAGQTGPVAAMVSPPVDSIETPASAVNADIAAALTRTERAAPTIADAATTATMVPPTTTPPTSAARDPVAAMQDEVEATADPATADATAVTRAATPAPAAQAAIAPTAASNAAAGVLPPPVAPVVSAPPVTAPIAPAPQVSRRAQALEWNELAKYRGRFIRVWTYHNPPRTVELLQAAGDELRVQARLGGGHAEFTIKRDGFIKATLVR